MDQRLHGYSEISTVAAFISYFLGTWVYSVYLHTETDLALEPSLSHWHRSHHYPISFASSRIIHRQLLGPIHRQSPTPTHTLTRSILEEASKGPLTSHSKMNGLTPPFTHPHSRHYHHLPFASSRVLAVSQSAPSMYHLSCLPLYNYVLLFVSSWYINGNQSVFLDLHSLLNSKMPPSGALLTTHFSMKVESKFRRIRLSSHSNLT